MITFASSNPSRQADLAMPISRCDDAAWLRALPVFMGEVSVQGTAVKGGIRIRTATTDVHYLPGNPAWRPPT
ncbi:MAG TPA: hypothetical protein VFG72_08665 [Marmoricola sp.]|nr:hypothetical protein [Marmoricola sp.]